MAQDVGTAIVNVNSVMRGADGTEVIGGVRRMAHRVEGARRTVPGDKMVKDSRETSGDINIAIETYSVREHSAHQTTTIEEKLVVVYTDFDGTVTRTYDRVRARRGGESMFPPADEDGPVPVHEIQFQVLQKAEGEGLDTAFSEVRS